jgi:hypothetical protein
MVAITNGRTRELRYIPPYTIKDERTIVATGLRETVLPCYPETAQLYLSVFYLGNRDMWYEYYDVDGDPPSSKQLFRDIRYLHDVIIRAKLSTQQIAASVSDFFAHHQPRQPTPHQALGYSELDESDPRASTPTKEPCIPFESTPYREPENSIDTPPNPQDARA